MLDERRQLLAFDFPETHFKSANPSLHSMSHPTTPTSVALSAFSLVREGQDTTFNFAVLEKLQMCISTPFLWFTLHKFKVWIILAQCLHSKTMMPEFFIQLLFFTLYISGSLQLGLMLEKSSSVNYCIVVMSYTFTENPFKQKRSSRCTTLTIISNPKIVALIWNYLQRVLCHIFCFWSSCREEDHSKGST